MAILYRLRLAAVLLAGLTGAAGAEGPGITLQNDRYVVEVSPRNGLITRIQDKRGKLELLQEPRLADNFKFSLPLPGKAAWQATEANYILGKDQRLTSHEVADARMVLKWNGPLTSIFGKSYAVSATMTIQLVDEDVRFTFAIRNAAKLEIGEVYYPILGGSLGLGEGADVRKKTELVLPGTMDIRKATIFHTFANFSWLGVIGPEQFYSYPDGLSMPWMELDHPSLRRGVYFGAHDPIARYKVVHLEMLPGIAGARADGNWPRPEELNGLPAGVKMCFVHFPYQPAGQDFEAAPVVLRFHDGDWHEGAKLYGNWLGSQCNLEKPRADWPYRTQAFQQCGAVPFKDLASWAKQGVTAGVKSLLLTEWKTGGAGSGIPRFEPDPRLGSPEELAQAIGQCHELGVKVAVVVNLPPATQLDEWYGKDLHQYACTDRWGIVYTMMGWHQGSPLTGGYGAGERRAWLNPGHPGMRKILAEQLRELAVLGVDGVHLQDFFARPLDFNPAVASTADRASWEGGIACINEIVKTCREVRPEFSVSTDSVWDRVLAVTGACSAEAKDSCALKTAFPLWQPTFTVADEDSLSAVNDALRYRGRLRIAPANGKPMGGTEMAAVVGYMKAALSVREILSRTLLDGERLDPDAIRVEGAVGRGVFCDKASGQRTAVLVNPGAGAVEHEVAGFAEPGGKAVLLWQPGEGARNVSFPTRVKIPGRQAAVLTEEPVLDRLAAVPRWATLVPNERVLFDFASADDLRGWVIEGDAFSVRPLGALGSRSTLNSLANSGETATGSAISPPFSVDGPFDRLEMVIHGGWSQKEQERENLAIRLVEAKTGALLEQILPPGTHELTTRSISLDKLRGKSVRLQLIDSNTAASFAWIGVRKVSLVGPDHQRPAK